MKLGACESDPTRDLRGTLETREVVHLPALVDPKEVANLIKDIEQYTERFVTVIALKRAPILFTRPRELRSLKWADLDKAQWRYTPPKTRKAISIRMIGPLPKLLRDIHPVTGHSAFVFPFEFSLFQRSNLLCITPVLNVSLTRLQRMTMPRKLVESSVFLWVLPAVLLAHSRCRNRC